jgi:hypothetical protein
MSTFTHPSGFEVVFVFAACIGIAIAIAVALALFAPKEEDR